MAGSEKDRSKLGKRIFLGAAVLVLGGSMLLYLVPQGPATGEVSTDTVAKVGDESVTVQDIRKQLDQAGHDSGAQTIAFHLERRHGHTPAVSTIWRVLVRRGFVMPQRNSRNPSSLLRASCVVEAGAFSAAVDVVDCPMPQQANNVSASRAE